ncbi:DUF6323 family protein [Paenibacillus chibensis]|uniref:DUF6323 family protein n=1 Tax=Paenibacillus chibensis TaxID=59846 RepID=A0ABU6PR79_9BACL|nr:DUF6323 family protein [Paenibacillus chibensis]
MHLSRIFHGSLFPTQDMYSSELLELNEKTREHGLILTPVDIEQMLVVRSQVLHMYGRVELGIEVSKRLIEVFSASSFIQQETYADTLNELHEVFYYLRNETEDMIGDMKLIDKMMALFEEECEGSLELLKSKLEEYAGAFRRELSRTESSQEGEDGEWDLRI